MVRCNFFDAILFVFFSAGITGQYENCTGQLDMINDGVCDMDNNNVDCGYDGGDCCECSCMNDRLYPCGIWGFNCSDPDVLDNAGDCRNETASIRHCASDLPVTWLVNDTASASSLAGTVNCSGGTFYVKWRGNILVERTLYIPHGTTLYVTGEGSGAEVNGVGKTRLFMVQGADLYLDGLILSNGNATYGGAIAATRSSIFVNQTLCRGNIASTYGGAIHVGISSTLSWEGMAMLADNHAGRGGGAVAVSMGSVASWSGPTEFSFNTAVGDVGVGGAVYVNGHNWVSWDGLMFFISNMAGSYGGAIFVDSSNVSWDGETSFVNNSAESYGGAFYVYSDSIVSWDGETSFVDNSAESYGGAFYVYLDSIVSWDGETSFVNNTASWSGGALYVFWYSMVSWDGETSFVDNSAEYGGALGVYFYSNVSWDAVTSFVNNMAVSGGGALYSDFATVSWDGVTSFIDNTAGYGGALYVYYLSIFSGNGVTSFAKNTAGQDGGALCIDLFSTISWGGVTSFVNNTAQVGGGLSINMESNVLWTGRTAFTGNSADSIGGSIYGTTSIITAGGDTNFLDNAAGTDGGAVYILGIEGTAPTYFIFDNNSTFLFQGNTCGGNGGAIALIGVVFTWFPPGVMFWRNTAGFAGGAIYMSGVTVGIQFEGTIFISNFAAMGGGIYSIASGTAVTEDVHGNPEQNPNTLIGCEFIGNLAMKTGGAMDSSSGRDMVVSSSFVANTALLGGALKLVGTTSLIGCVFANNLSGEDEGPGIINDGIIAPILNCSFVDNVFNCPTDFFLDYSNTGALFDTVCKGCETRCGGCTVEGKEPVCLEKLEHSSSVGGNTTLESLLIEGGYWRATKTSIDILACYNNEACLGGLTNGKDYCRNGYEGPYCSVCSKGYTPSLGFACNNCSDNAAGDTAFAVIMTGLFLMAFAALISYMLSGEIEEADQSVVARVARFIPIQSVKIVIVVWQILTQFSTVANVNFPGVYQRFLDGVDILNFDLSWVRSVGCIMDTDFHDRLLLATLGPLVFMVILGGTYVTAMRRNVASEEARGIVRRKHMSMVLLLTFLVYSSVSSILFKTFACDDLDDGNNYLRADYRIECDSIKHNALKIYAGFMIILYVVGIPAFYGILLYNNRKALMNAEREEDESIKPITNLWKPYRPDRFYYEIIECIRRVLLTGALVFIYPKTAAQVAVALMMAAFFIFVSEALAPYASSWDMWCSRMGQALVFTSMFLALLLKVDVSGERTSSQRVFESVLIAAHSCLILIVVVEAAAIVMAWMNEVKEDIQPRICPSLSVLSPGVGRGGTILEECESPPSYENVVGNLS